MDVDGKTRPVIDDPGTWRAYRKSLSRLIDFGDGGAAREDAVHRIHEGETGGGFEDDLGTRVKG
jgi:hypothetical protein